MWSLVRDFSEHELTFARYIEYKKANVCEVLLISLLPYDEVSAFLLFVKSRNSSLLTGRPICLS